MVCIKISWTSRWLTFEPSNQVIANISRHSFATFSSFFKALVFQFAMRNLQNIACLILGLGSLLGSALPAEVGKVHGTTKSSKSNGTKKSGGSSSSNGATTGSPASLNTLDTSSSSSSALGLSMSFVVNGTNKEVPASCIATSYDTYKAIVSKCPTSILKDIKVPVNGQICLSNLKSQTVRAGPSLASRAFSNKRIGCFRRHNRLCCHPGRPRPNLSSNYIQLIFRHAHCRSRR